MVMESVLCHGDSNDAMETISIGSRHPTVRQVVLTLAKVRRHGPWGSLMTATKQVEGGDQLLEDESTDDEVVTIAEVHLDDNIKR